MSCGNNITYFRKKLNITQESLAEKMDVTRQTVSRWETDSAFPETEKLIELCNLFNCSMDLLVRGDAEAEYLSSSSEKKDFSAYKPIKPSVDLDTYDKHMNKFALSMASGVFLILSGIALMLMLNGLTSLTEAVTAAIFMGFVTVAVTIFISFGIWHGNFAEDDFIKPVYPEEYIKKLKTFFAIAITSATFLILVGVIFIIISENFNIKEEFAAGIFMLFIAFAVFIYVLSGIMYSKIEKNKTASSSKEKKSLSDTICGIIMLLCTMVYLFLGFVHNLWHPGWVVFPIGGISCGIVSIIFEAIGTKNNKNS